MKYPILYQNATDALQHSQGLGILSEASQNSVQRDSNAIPVLTVVYPRTGRYAKTIDHDMVLVTDMGDKDDEKRQGFRISNITKSQDSLIITAPSLAGDLARLRITKQVTSANCTISQAWNALSEAFVYPMPMVHFYSNVLRVANINWKVSDDPVTSFLLGADQAGDKVANTMQAMYGVDFKFDNYNIKAVDNESFDTGKIIKWNQNMSNLTLDESMDDYYDGIYPYAKFTPTEIPDDYTSEGKAYDGVADVQYVGAGGAPVFNTPYKGHNQVGTLKNGSYYHIKSTQSDNTINGDTWYQVDDGQWIDEHFISFDKSKAFIVNKLKNGAQGTIAIPEDSGDSTGLIVSYQGVGSIVYSGRGGVAVWNSPFPGHSLTGKYLKNGSRWKIFEKVDVSDGHSWYNLGGEQWVDGQYFSIQKTTDYAVTPTRGILQIKKKPVSYTGPGMQKQTNWNPKAGSRWKVGHWATGSDGSTLYQVSTYIWVKDDDDTVDFTANGTVQPNQDSDRIAIAKKTGKVPIYSEPNGVHATEYWVKVGEQHQIFAQAENNGRTWYEIGVGQWVDASYFNFDGDSDVSPGDDDGTGDDQGVEVEEQTIELPEKYILGSSAIHTENPKIKTVDLSEYNPKTVDDLRNLANAYIREYRIGIVPTSLTVGYQQMHGDYECLTSVDLYDIVGVQFDELGIAQKAKVNSVTWDNLLQTYTSLTIGDLPVSYEHALGNYIKEQNTQTKNYATKKATHLFSEMKHYVDADSRNKGDQIASLIKISDELGISWKSQQQTNEDLKDKADLNNRTLQALDESIKDINQKVQEAQTTAEQLGGIFEAEPNWQYPQAIHVKNGDGSQMIFTGNGLEFKAADGVPRTVMDINGNIGAEHIIGGTVEAVKVKGVALTGTSYINSYDPNVGYTVASGTNGFSTDSGLKVKGWSNLQSVNVNGGLVVNGRNGVTDSGAPLQILTTYGGTAIMFNTPGNRFLLQAYDDGRLIWNGHTVVTR